MKKPNHNKLVKFLQQSNWIESEYSDQAIVDALEAWNIFSINPFSIENLLSTHKALMQNLRPDIAGKFRNCDVFIGGERKKFIHEIKFIENIEQIFKEIIATIDFCKEDKGVNPKTLEEVAKKLHVEFEKIHPFEDGNGRVGRIIWQLHRLHMGLPISIIHTGKEQQNYYLWFKE